METTEITDIVWGIFILGFAFGILFSMIMNYIEGKIEKHIERLEKQKGV